MWFMFRGNRPVSSVHLRLSCLAVLQLGISRCSSAGVRIPAAALLILLLLVTGGLREADVERHAAEAGSAATHYSRPL